jgi:DNA-binding transcriptional LysR family regulator
LFERSKSGTRLTPDGYEFLASARRILEEIDRVFARLNLRRRGERGELSIGVYTSLSAGNLRATLADYYHRFGKVEIHAVDGARQRLLSELAIGSIDVAILTAEGLAWNGRTLPLWTERVVLALPEDHRLGSLAAVQWSDLLKEHLLFNQREPGPEFEHLLMTKLENRDDLWITRHDVGLDRLLSLVGAGLGITLVAEGATGAAYAGVTYREVRDESGPTRLNFLACWRQSNRNLTLASFLAILRDRYPDLAVSTGAPDG